MTNYQSPIKNLPATYVIEEEEEPDNEIKMRFPDLQSSNGGVAVLVQPSYERGNKQGDGIVERPRKLKVTKVSNYAMSDNSDALSRLSRKADA